MSSTKSFFLVSSLPQLQVENRDEGKQLPQRGGDGVCHLLRAQALTRTQGGIDSIGVPPRGAGS